MVVKVNVVVEGEMVVCIGVYVECIVCSVQYVWFFGKGGSFEIVFFNMQFIDQQWVVLGGGAK